MAEIKPLRWKEMPPSPEQKESTRYFFEDIKVGDVLNLERGIAYFSARRVDVFIDGYLQADFPYHPDGSDVRWEGTKRLRINKDKPGKCRVDVIVWRA